ncbi:MULTISPECIES: 4Fe-4S binding protein [Rhodanobacter]|nr:MULTISPECIES: 4Fe-4S dicluster domain-containing protein [Rhodanobacter]UJJ52753.1 4Fe-4S binding protein [Rhodanobacter denitrificans]UJJ58353.1 4Fe-4S binding protein [Rhodanobacter denitrificans]UJM95524.1 4Fe-4S binding protein [Rhodanobacter denitrificans]UJM99055.1 4Fe-4S binding protein [Rhodanobacter denitrificans]UJN21530.1 4Fe-4S binding protein [Rhodanobacter denitrificans]
MPQITAERCSDDCQRCEQVCPTQAIRLDTRGHLAALDYGRCIACQLCVEVCPSSTLQPSEAWAFGVRERADLQWTLEPQALASEKLAMHIEKSFRGSLHIRHVDAGSCNGCESELQALNNPFYNLHRLGIFFTASPRAADLLLVTGTVTAAMHEPLLATWQAMAEPRRVLACGTCAVSGGVCGGTYASGKGLDGILPVDIWLPGCPPNPAAIIEALLLLLERKPQRVQGGRPHEP